MNTEDHGRESPSADDSTFDPAETNLKLLNRTQRFLQAQLKRQVPDTLLAESWGEFYRVYNTLIRSFVLSHGLRGADVEDCVQEVWSSVATKLANFERPKNRPGLRSWLYTVVRSKTMDLIRREKRRSHENLDAALEMGDEPSSGVPDPAMIFEKRWENAMVQTAIEELRPNISDVNFRILRMRLIEGRPEAEVAKAVGLTAEQVRYRKHRTQKKLQALLAVYTGNDFG